MIRLEQAGYPYFPGRSGINFESIDFAGKNTTRRIKGESNSALRYKISNLGIEIYDVNCKAFKMVAGIEDVDAIAFDLRTRYNGLRQKDMFAERFQRFAIHNLERMGNTIRYWISTWKGDSDNYLQFNQALKEGLDKVSAARSTWTAGSAENKGFYILRRDSINDDEAGEVTVTFVRKD